MRQSTDNFLALSLLFLFAANLYIPLYIFTVHSPMDMYGENFLSNILTVLYAGD